MNRPGSRVVRVATACLASFAVAAMLPTAASAATVSPLQLHSSGSQGVVAVTPKVYLVFWGSQWSTDPARAAPALKAFFKGLYGADDTWGMVLDQYCQGLALNTVHCGSAGTHVRHPTKTPLAGVWFDNASPEPASANATQLHAEVAAAATHFGNTTQSSNRYAQYVIASPHGTRPGGLPTSGDHTCARHSSTNTPYGRIAYTNLPYLPDQGSGACYVQLPSSTPLEVYTIIESHEYAETVTDLWGHGWRDSSGKEIGDKCEAGAAPDALEKLTTGTFAVQALWSNKTESCVTTSTPQWTPQATQPQAGTNASPALTYFNGKLYAAWVGTTGHAVFYSSLNGKRWSHQATIRGPWGQALTAQPPALAVANGLLYAAWTGKGAAGAIYYSTFDGTTWSRQATVSGSWGTATTDRAPALGVNRNNLFIAYKGHGSNRVYYSSASSGTWQSPLAVPGAITTVAPAVVGTPKAKYSIFTFAWTTRAHQIHTRALIALGWAPIQVLPKALTERAPAMALLTNNNTLVLAWKGTGSSTKIFYDYAFHFRGSGDTFAAQQTEPEAGTNLAPALAGAGATLTAAWRGTTSPAIFYSRSTSPF